MLLWLPLAFAHYLSVRTLCTRALTKPLSFSTNFSESFQGETTIGLDQPGCTPKWHYFPMGKSAHPWTWDPPCILSSHWPQYTCSTVSIKYLFQEGESRYSAFSVRGTLWVTSETWCHEQSPLWVLTFCSCTHSIIGLKKKCFLANFFEKIPSLLAAMIYFLTVINLSTF